MSLVITSRPKQQIRRGTSQILGALGRRINVLRNKAILDGIIAGLKEISEKDTGRFSKTIARLTGDMRTAFEQGINQILTTKSHDGRTVITWEEIMRVVILLDTHRTKYFTFHFRSRGFYKMPSEPGTFPMRFSRFKPMATIAINKHILINLRKIRAENITEFSIS